jgi:epoxyqueuosine reductase
MREAIRQRARELGFDDCRFTTASPPASAARFEQWLKEQRQGEMAYLARNAQKRIDPRRVLPGAKSLIVLAVSYAEARRLKDITKEVGGENQLANTHLPTSSIRQPEFGTEKASLGIVARYARYEDYHEVIGTCLRALSEFTNRLGGPESRSLWYVDTGPILERDLAQRAGLGFIGKHTNLIGRQLGNWFFVAEILTTLELEPDPPERNHCGSCARCLSACPTGAITAPFQLDARRCISYLTIELKGPIPVELRPAIGNRVYGCDDCLTTCPWNRFAREGSLMRAHARPDLAQPALLDLLSLDEGQFKRRFAGTPLLRTKRRGLLRNVCVALGNSKDPAALPALERASCDPEPLIAEHSEWAIGEICKRTAHLHDAGVDPS